MKRLNNLSFCVFAFVFLVFTEEVRSADRSNRPNILLIVSEDNGPELGCYGDPYVKTPVLDKLAQEGVRFENAFVPQAGCSQSRAAFLTGLYPHQNGQIGLATWKFRMYRQGAPNIVRSLKQAGYRTGIIGKLHINPASAFPFDMHEIPSSNFGRKGLADYAKHAEEFFSAGNEPFFLSVNYPDAHRPFTRQVNGQPENPLTGDDVKPLAYFGLDTPQLRDVTADYYNCMSRLDSLIGELLSALKKSGKAEETMTVYLGDHGADMLRGKRTSYEGGVRVPLIIKHAGKAESEPIRPELVSTLDLMPTFLAVAGAEPVANLPGRSLLPLLRDEQTDWREYLFTEFHLHSAHNFYPQRTVRNGRYKLIHNLMPGETNPGYDFTLNRFFADLPEAIDAAPAHIRDAYRRMRSPPEYELYDLQVDPYEFRNLVSDDEYGETLTRLKNQLAQWRTRTNDPLLNSNNLKRLKAEVEACIVNGKADKSRLELTYPDYFFTTSAAAEPDRSPNVLFIAIDDLRPALGCYDDKVAITPNIDALASRGTVFNQAYCQLAVCCPSRLSLMTGRRPDTIRVWDLATHFRQTIPDAVTLPQHFRNHGYHTQSIGKIYHGGGKPSKDAPSWSVDPQYDVSRAANLRYALPKNLQGSGLKRAATESADVGDGVYLDGIVCRTAETTIENLAAKEKPFFLAVGFRKPHLPFCAPKKYWDLYERDRIPLPEYPKHPQDAPELAVRSWKELEGYTDIPADGQLTEAKVRELRHGYYACVSYVDALVGRLLNRLQQAKLADNTVVVLWGDHGFHLGEQGLWTKANNYELSTRVPLIISTPRQKHAGSRSDALVELVDVFPTLADVCGLKDPTGMEGISLKPLLAEPDRSWKNAVFSQYPRARNSNRHRGHGDIMGYAVRTERYRYVEWQEWETKRVIARELYDLASDPHETRNIAKNSDNHKTVKELERMLSAGWTAATKLSTGKHK